MEQAAADRELVERITSGDQTALAALFARHQVRVFRFISRITGSDAVAEELVNEVFMDVWKQASRFEARSAVSTWLLSIARNKAFSAMRRRREVAMDDETGNTLADDADTPDITAQKSNKADVIRSCMNHLSAEHREIIDLVYYHEMPIAEVSSIVGIPENTVKTRMFHARKRLSILLVEAGVDRGWP